MTNFTLGSIDFSYDGSKLTAKRDGFFYGTIAYGIGWNTDTSGNVVFRAVLSTGEVAEGATVETTVQEAARIWLYNEVDRAPQIAEYGHINAAQAALNDLES